jgi:hypothetical protein
MVEITCKELALGRCKTCWMDVPMPYSPSLCPLDPRIDNFPCEKYEGVPMTPAEEGGAEKMFIKMIEDENDRGTK